MPPWCTVKTKRAAAAIDGRTSMRRADGQRSKVRQWAREQGGSVGEDGVAQMCGSPEIVEGSFMPLPGRERSSRS